MATIDKKPRRAYVLDTNVLLHDPASIFRFDEHDVIVPMTVLEELDRLKTGTKDIARTARQVVRTFSELLNDVATEQVADGIPLPGSESRGSGRLFFLPPMEFDAGAVLPKDSPDNCILETTLTLQRQRPNETVVLVTKDVNLRVKCAARGIPAEDYRNDQVLDDIDTMIRGYAELEPTFWDELHSEVRTRQMDGHTYYEIEDPITTGWHPGMLVSTGESGGFEAMVRTIEDRRALLTLCKNYRSHSVWGACAQDQLQNFALNLLLDDQIDLVTIVGSAGTGKTFLAMAAALHLTYDQQRFKRIIITRETVSIGEDIGYLPGTEEEKMAPWMGAFMDNLESLGTGVEKDSQASVDFIMKRVQLRSLSFMRGRTFNDTLLIIDEAQNLTPKQIKSLITRAGRNTKIVCLGNVAQIDTPYLTPTTCGLTYLVQRFQDWPHAGHITLSRIQRSRLALRAEEVL